ncbi:hypothetical protein ACJX0J_039587, partial [Zea mays]
MMELRGGGGACDSFQKPYNRVEAKASHLGLNSIGMNQTHVAGPRYIILGICYKSIVAKAIFLIIFLILVFFKIPLGMLKKGNIYMGNLLSTDPHFLLLNGNSLDLQPKISIKIIVASAREGILYPISSFTLTATLPHDMNVSTHL